MFHMPQYVPRSAAANHDVKMLAHAGAPTPCNATGRRQQHHQQQQHLASDLLLMHLAAADRPTELKALTLHCHAEPLSRCNGDDTHMVVDDAAA